jgi:hypothetical protein
MEIKLLAFLLVYFMPTLLAPRGARFDVGFVNILLGWTVLGWFWAWHLARAARTRDAFWRQNDCAG